MNLAPLAPTKDESTALIDAVAPVANSSASATLPTPLASGSSQPTNVASSLSAPEPHAENGAAAGNNTSSQRTSRRDRKKKDRKKRSRSPIATLSRRAAKETDDRVRLELYKSAVDAMTMQWWYSPHWCDERLKNAVMAKQRFQREHKRFAFRYPMMFQKIMKEEVTVDPKERKTWDQYLQKLQLHLNPNANKEQKESVKQDFVYYGARKYLKPWLKPGVKPVADGQ